jgi:O-antigen/teichoic acid export membrane protein
VPFWGGLARFVPELVRPGRGEHWRPAVGIIQAFGLIAGFDQIAYNWDDYLRARGETRPIGIVNLVTMTVYLAAAMPLLALDGLGGFEVGMAIAAVIGVSGRVFYLTRLFEAFDIASHIVRGLAPTVPAALLVLAVRGLHPGGGLATALLELVAYVLVAATATLLLERPLLREIIGYLAPRPAI